jgi:hypothetical protein
VASEQEAALVCGFLGSNGVEATYDKGGVFQPLSGLGGATGTVGSGRQEILVRAEDADRARELLERLPG